MNDTEEVVLSVEMIEAVMQDYFNYVEQLKEVGMQVDHENNEDQDRIMNFLDNTVAIAQQYLQFRIEREDEES